MKAWQKLFALKTGDFARTRHKEGKAILTVTIAPSWQFSRGEQSFVSQHSMSDLESIDGLDWERIATKVDFLAFSRLNCQFSLTRSLLIPLAYLNVLRRSVKFDGWVIGTRDLITPLGLHLKSLQPKHWSKVPKKATSTGCPSRRS